MGSCGAQDLIEELCHNSSLFTELTRHNRTSSSRKILKPYCGPLIKTYLQ